ncbi:DUF397 domain-containing protein [Nocardiopsis rhodophaea]|uniref:DUF397 domain-containing protein n=1 Tax=Nocardiopsis rhodophaea TaxID=280238 RepID=UPI0031D8E6EB
MYSPTELAFHKSSHSSTARECVEVAALPEGGGAVRDSKRPEVGHLAFGTAEWAAFLQGARTREF